VRNASLAYPAISLDNAADYAVRLIHPARFELLHDREDQPIAVEAMQVPECSLDAAVGKQAGWVVCMLFHT